MPLFVAATVGQPDGNRASAAAVRPGGDVPGAAGGGSSAGSPGPAAKLLSPAAFHIPWGSLCPHSAGKAGTWGAGRAGGHWGGGSSQPACLRQDDGFQLNHCDGVFIFYQLL